MEKHKIHVVTLRQVDYEKGLKRVISLDLVFCEKPIKCVLIKCIQNQHKITATEAYIKTVDKEKERKQTNIGT